MTKFLVEQYTEQDYTMEQLVSIFKEKIIGARKNNLCLEFITTRPVVNSKNEIVGVTTDFPAELNIYAFK